MARLDDMRVFAQLAESGSVTAAARALGVPKQTVSRRLAALEEALGLELARRTTRSLTLTDVGRAYASRCAEVVRLADEANLAAASHLGVASGLLRVTADPVLCQAFLPRLVAEYAASHPAVEVAIISTARKVDLVEEGFDVAFRVGPPPNVGYLAATRLGSARLWTVAAPAYLQRAGAPSIPGDLEDHECVGLVPDLSALRWPFVIEGKLELVAVGARISVNDLSVAHHAALVGTGIAHLPEFAVRDDVAAGRLLRVLESFTPEVGGVHVVYPHSRLLAPKVAEFVATAVAMYRRAFPAE